MDKVNSPRVWRACLACYNSGSLIGAWIDATDIDAIQTFEKAHEAATGHEEYAIHDYDEMPDLGEYPDLHDVSKVAEAVEQHGYDVVKGFINWLDVESLDKFDEAFRGVFDDEEEFAAQLADEIGIFCGCNKTVEQYFNYEAFARDLFMGDFYSVDVAAGVAVFDANI